MGKGFCRVYKHIQPKYTYPYPDGIFGVPPRSLFTSQHGSSNNCGVSVISYKHPTPISNLTSKTQVYTDSNNDDYIKSFATPRKHNHSTHDIPGTTTTNTPVQATVYSRLCQMSSSTSTKSLKLPQYVKEYLCFKSGGKPYYASQCEKSSTLTKLIDLII